MSIKRLQRELAGFRAAGSPALESLEPNNGTDILHWVAVLKGPEGSPYEGGRWTVDVRVPENYPLMPPTMHFRTRICHPNIHFDSGEVCIDVLKSQWTPAWHIASALLAVQVMLASPEPDSPLNIDAANLVRSGEHRGYADLIQYYKRVYATPSS